MTTSTTTTTTTTTTAPTPDLTDVLPPADPAPLVGRTYRHERLFDENGLPVDVGQWPTIVDNQITELRTVGGSCLTETCDRAAEFLVAAADLIDGTFPTSRYLVVGTMIDRIDDLAVWRIDDVVLIAGRSDDETLTPVTDACDLPGLDAALLPIAASFEPGDQPTTPDTLWVFDTGLERITNPAVKPDWQCLPMSD